MGIGFSNSMLYTNHISPYKTLEGKTYVGHYMDSVVNVYISAVAREVTNICLAF